MNSFTVEFRIEGPLLIPSNITKILGLIPARIENVGDSINPKRKNIALWSYDGISTERDFIETKWETLEEGLHFLLDQLLPKKNLIQENLNQYKRYLWCGHFQENFEGKMMFSAQLLSKLSDFKTELIICNYFSEGEEISEFKDDV